MNPGYPVRSSCRSQLALWRLHALLLLGLVIALGGCKRTSAADSDAGTPAASASAAPQASSEPAQGLRSARAPFLWKIEGERPSWLLGTIHVPDARVEALWPGIEPAFAAAESVMTEMPMDGGTQVRFADKLRLPAGKELKTELPVPLYKRTDQAFQSVGMPLAALSNMKVWAVAVQLVMLDHLSAFVMRKPIDALVWDRAAAANKETSGLETPDEQIAVFDGLTKAEQVHMLGRALDTRDAYKKEGKDPLELLLGAYLSGDDLQLLAAVERDYDRNDPTDVRLMKRLVDDRNVIMADRIDAALRKAPRRPLFVAIGSAHLVGKGSVVELLQAKGHKVVRAPVARTPEPAGADSAK